MSVLWNNTCRLNFRRMFVVSVDVATGSTATSIEYKKLFSRWNRRTLPLEPRYRCKSGLPNSCLRNDVLASRLLTKHISAHVWVLFTTWPSKLIWVRGRGLSTLGLGGHRPPKFWPGPPPNILVLTAKIRILKI